MPAFPPPMPECRVLRLYADAEPKPGRGQRAAGTAPLREVDRDKLREYLAARNSLLRHEPYFSTIMDTAL